MHFYSLAHGLKIKKPVRVTSVIDCLTKNEEENYLRREYKYNSFRRSFQIPERLVDAEKIKAKYDKGILNITLPKKEEAKPKPAKKIKIS